MKLFKKVLSIAIFLAMPLYASAQNISVSGVVKDNTGYGAIGASVIQQGTTNGVVTDLDGKYTISVPANATLVFSSIGFKDEVIAVNGQTSINVTLQEDNEMLEETVVIGYGTQKKKLVTGATLNIGGDAIQKQNTTNALGALYSSVPGVNIVQSTGQPWDEFSVTIRGLSTTGNSKPLYVIDGVAGGDISSLNPADIESIDILKDAASAAIYGARAASGVILVTTRQGQKTKKVHITFDASYGIQKPNFNGVHALNAQEYIDYINKSFVDQGVIAEGDMYDSVKPELYPVQYQWMQQGKWNGTDWLAESVNKNAPTRNMVVGINGGNDIVRYSLSFSKSYIEGTLGYPKISFFDRTTIRANSDFSLIRKGDRDILKFGENATITISDNNGVSTGNLYNSTVHTALVHTPLLPAYDLDGSLYGFDDQTRDEWMQEEGAYNLLERASLSNDREGKNYRLQGNAYLEYMPIKQVKIRTAFGYRYSANFSRSYTPEYRLSSSQYKDKDQVDQNSSVYNSWSWETTATWKETFGDHSVDGLVGASIEGTGWGMSNGGWRRQTKFGTWEAANFSQCESVLSPETASMSGSNTVPFNDLVSFFARANYSYKDKYLLTLIVREDGSSNFADGHRWGFFPSASAGWIISEEPWMEWAKDYLNYWKFRGSWGRNGNCAVNNFQYLASVSLGGAYDFTPDGTATSTGAYPDIIQNPNLTWETSEQTDLGFDARFFKSRLGVTFDWYRKDTKDWLVKAPILATMGADAPTINGGAVRNSGIELSFTWNDNIGDLRYSLGVNGSYNKNKVLYINNEEGIIHGASNVISENIGAYNTFEAKEGYPIGYFVGIASEGIFQNQKQIDEYNAKEYSFISGYDKAKPGDVIWIDQNGDGQYDKNDLVEVGNPHPDFTLGLNISLEYKGVDFAISGSGAFGQQVLQSYRSFANHETDNYTNNFIARCWNGEGSTNSFPRFCYGKHNNFYCNGYLGDVWAQNADYFKIRNITIGYDLKKGIKSLPFESLRIYFTGQNLFTFTGYDGMDPEVGYGAGYSWASGIDIGYYPSPKTYLAGISIRF